MTPNPVCYNGLNLPNDAIHMRSVSLGIRPKDYRADTAQRWRSGISPSGAVVLYSNTFYLGLTTEEVAEPRIWWTNPASSVADFKLKISELLSRLPERTLKYQTTNLFNPATDVILNYQTLSNTGVLNINANTVTTELLDVHEFTHLKITRTVNTGNYVVCYNSASVFLGRVFAEPVPGTTNTFTVELLPDTHFIRYNQISNNLATRAGDIAAFGVYGGVVDYHPVFADYDEAIDWLRTSQGKYALVNDNYPEYYIPGEYCLFNVETGLLASYPASGLNIYNLANPNQTVGNQLNQYSLSWNGFTITNATGDLNIGLIGQEPGLAYNTTGHIISIDNLPKEAYLSNNLVFEAVINIVYSQSACVFNLIDSSNMADVLRVDWDASTEQFVAYYSDLGSIIRFGQVTTPWVGDIHLIISVPATNDPKGINEAAAVVDGVTYKVSSITGSSYQWENTTFFQIGNNADLNSPIHKLKSAKAYSVPLDSVSTVLDELISINNPEVVARY